MADEKSINREQPKKKDKAVLRVLKLVLVIGKDTLPRKQIMADLDLGGRRNFLDRYQNPAFAKGYIKMLFPESPNSPEQAYRLTAKGLELFESLTQESPSEQSNDLAPKS